MSSSMLVFAYLQSIILLIIIAAVNGQIPREKIPPELQFVLDPELEKWKAPEELEKLCPYYLSGFDEENRPIWVVELALWPLRDILARGPEWVETYSNYSDQFIMRVLDSTKLRSTPENPVTEYDLIIDMDNYNIKHISSVKAFVFNTEKFKLIAKAARFAHTTIIVNNNYFAGMALNILRPVLGQALEDVEVFGTNSNIWIPKLLKILPRDQLSPKYGGKEDFKPFKMHG